MKSAIERAGKYIRPDPDTGCWVWTGNLTGAGYGQLTLTVNPRRNVMAHRLVYESHVGPIPDGLELDHLCRKPACVNPDHLQPVTHRENVKRGNAATARKAQAATITHCKRGHPLSGDNLIQSARQRRCKTCAWFTKLRYLRRKARAAK